MKAKQIKKFFFFWMPFLTLLIMSLFLMYHAKFITDIYQNLFERQCLWFGIGFVILLICRYIPWKKLINLSPYLYLINVILLILVLFIGDSVNGSKAWIDLKYFSFQPSELMKFSLALYLAHFCSQKKLHNLKEEIMFLFKGFFIVLIPSILVFLEPDTGAILFYFLMSLILLWNSPIKKRWFFFISFLIFSVLLGFFYCYFYQKDLLITLIGTSFFYRVDRLLNLGVGMQIENAKIALGSAPLIRFSITETGIYIPESPTDFAFALTSNVFGFLGNVVILLCFFLIDCFLLSLCQKERKKSKKLFFLAFLTSFISNQVINIAMNLGLFPIIGVPLPFISYGGSSTIVLFLFLGFLFPSKKERKEKD